MSIGKRLEELINYRNTNVNRVAREAGISPQTIYGIIKRDNTKVDINILMALSKELNVTLDYFSGGPLDAVEVDVETFVSSMRTARPSFRLSSTSSWNASRKLKKAICLAELRASHPRPSSGRVVFLFCRRSITKTMLSNLLKYVNSKDKRFVFLP